MLATTKGIYNDGVVVFQSKPNLHNGDEVIVTYEIINSEPKKEHKVEWGFIKTSKMMKEKYPNVILSDAVAEERESYR
ncbi:MAG: hypothetical protein EAZ53_09480 [Bacteroidetes bacterium]|nr:MAG: hypothetical protein EAZ53_09480 [Bacteroidota bacterium]